MSLRELRRYGLLYLICYIGLTVALMIVVSFMPKLQSAHLGFAIIFGSSSFTFQKFINDKERLPTSSEYWSLVFLSTAISATIDSLLTAWILYDKDQDMSDILVWLIIIVGSVSLGALLHMLFYSNFRGRSYLKHIERKRQT